MSWNYQQSTGILRDRRGVVAGVGYSGCGAGRNAPCAQTMFGLGPIPRGLWDIVGPPEDNASHGPYVLRLEPYIDNKTFDREGFVIAGDDSGQSEAPIGNRLVLPLVVRKDIWESGDHTLEVVA